VTDSTVFYEELFHLYRPWI